MDDVCIFGAGAVGGHLAARLAATGRHRVSVVARGPMLAAIRTHGLRVLREDGSELRGRPDAATDDATTLPAQSLVIVTLKAWQVPGAADAIARLLAPEGVALFAINGIPWWWGHGPHGSTGPLPLLDPQGRLWTGVRPQRALGAVVWSPNEVVEPGVIRHRGPNRLVIGEPDGSVGPRLHAVLDTLGRGGIEVAASADLRRDVLGKLLLNVSGNVLTALTRRDLHAVGTDPALCALSVEVMREALAVAAALGVDLREGIDLEAVARRGPPGLRPSMLQDVLAGRPMEVDAILGQLQAFARLHRVPVPAIDLLLPLLRGLDASLRAA